MSKRIYRTWPKATVEKWAGMRQGVNRETYKAIGEMYNPPLQANFVFLKIQQLHEGVLK